MALVSAVFLCACATQTNELPPPHSTAAKTIHDEIDGWRITFSDEFNGSGPLLVGTQRANWRYEMMDDGLHRAGNSGIDAAGKPTESWNSVKGKRWSAWYNDHLETNAYRKDGKLILRGLHSREIDRTRPTIYKHRGSEAAFGQSKLYTAWIDTFARKWKGPGDLHVMDPDSPGKIFKYGYFEARVSFEKMITPGFRLSLWLMPASTDALGQNLVVSNAYDENGNNGVEIDIFEYEWLKPEYANKIQLAVHGGAAGSVATTFDTSPLGIDLHQGFHTIGFLWQPDSMIWSIDGKIVKTVTKKNLIPDVYSYLILSREMNSGVKSRDTDNVTTGDKLAQPPYIPRDPGLYASNIWKHRELLNDDKAIIDFIRVWQP